MVSFLRFKNLTRLRFKNLTRFRAHKSGSVAVEFSMVAMAFAVTTLGIIEFGRVLHVRNQLSYTVDFAVRQIMINPTSSNTLLSSAIRNEFYGHNPDDLTVGITTETHDGVEFRKFVLSYPMELSIPFVNKDMTLSVTRRAPVI
jgi:Flp pilus assembly protein TadG